MVRMSVRADTVDMDFALLDGGIARLLTHVTPTVIVAALSLFLLTITGVTGKVVIFVEEFAGVRASRSSQI
jgi:hypothetical protein